MTIGVSRKWMVRSGYLRGYLRKQS
jgi:hypothetical protein